MEEDAEESKRKFVALYNHVSSGEMDAAVYKDIAMMFTQPLSAIENDMKIEILKKFVKFSGPAIYINEIRNLLLYSDAELFKEYGMQFIGNKGCWDVFGIVSESSKKCNDGCGHEGNRSDDQEDSDQGNCRSDDQESTGVSQGHDQESANMDGRGDKNDGNDKNGFDEKYNRKRKIRFRNKIKQDAKAIAAENYAKKLEMKEEKKKRRREFEKLLKKENSIQ